MPSSNLNSYDEHRTQRLVLSAWDALALEIGNLPMLLTHDQIKADIASGAITAIALDTTIFEKSQNRFEHAPCLSSSSSRLLVFTF